MKLITHPELIANLQHRLLNHEQESRQVQEALSQANGEIETAIAFDKTLTNDAQRKAKRLELTTDAFYPVTLAAALSTQDEKTRMQIELELLKNQFSVMKLEMRLAIVQQEAIAA